MRLLRSGIGLMGLAVCLTSAAEGQDTSLRHKSTSEVSQIYKKKTVSSTYPVEIRRKGTSLLVTSEHTQMLPVYKGNGVFYAMFRLSKGTNWISGLPRGTYIINNSRITVS